MDGAARIGYFLSVVQTVPRRNLLSGQDEPIVGRVGVAAIGQQTVVQPGPDAAELALLAHAKHIYASPGIVSLSCDVAVTVCVASPATVL